MELQVLAKRENPLLRRVELTFKAIHKAEPTPTRDALRAFLAKELKAPREHVVVDHAASTFGRYETLGYAKIYRSKEDALAIEPAHILLRNKLVEPEGKEAKPGEAPKAEKPAKEEKPAAEKKEVAKPAAKPEKPTPKKAEEKPAEKKEEKKAEAKAEKPEAKKAVPKKKES